MATRDVFADLRDEYAQLDAILSGLTNDQWLAPSDAPGWTICDVVMHLATSEEGVCSSLANPDPVWTSRDVHLDDAVAAQVARNESPPAETFARWRTATANALEAFAAADPAKKVRWAAAPLLPRTLATTRIAEHWAHGLDITAPLNIDFADTDRLRHIAWLGHRTLPYGCSLAGIDAQPVRAELAGPAGDSWSFGPSDADNRITGSASEWCRIGAQRLTAAESSLETSGPFAADALRVLRNYAA